MQVIKADRHCQLLKTEVLRERKYTVISTQELNVYDLIDIVNEIKGGKLKNKIIFKHTDNLTPSSKK
jgi:hypothetical protein